MTILVHRYPRPAPFPAVARALGAALLLAGSVVAANAQATIADCEKIQAADAYNQCLAKFGPTSKVKNLAPERPGDVKNSSEEAAAGAERAKHATKGGAVSRHARHGRGGHAARRGGRGARHGGGHGRKRMTVTIHRRR